MRLRASCSHMVGVCGYRDILWCCWTALLLLGVGWFFCGSRTAVIVDHGSFVPMMKTSKQYLEPVNRHNAAACVVVL